MTYVKEVPASNAQISGVLFGIANDDGCFGRITRRILRLTINTSCLHNYLCGENLCNKWQDCTLCVPVIMLILRQLYSVVSLSKNIDCRLQTLERNVIWQHILLPACHA